MEEQLKKKCSKCEEVKELTLFYKDKYSKDGRMGCCKECDNCIRRPGGKKRKLREFN